MEQPIVEQAGIPLAALRVEDPQLRMSPRRTEPVASDGHFRPLPDDVPPETDPRPAGQLETQPRRLGDGMGDGLGETGRLEDDEERLGPTSQGDQPMEAILEGRPTNTGVQAGREVDQQQVHRPGREERAGEGKSVGQRPGRKDDEPLQPDPASDRFDRIERPGEIQPGHDGAGGLGLRRKPQGEGGPPTRGISAQSHARRSRQAARPEDGVECREPGRDDLARGYPGGRGQWRLHG